MEHRGDEQGDQAVSRIRWLSRLQLQWSDSRRNAVLPYIYRHGFGKEVHRISNHGRTLFGHGGQSHDTHVMEASSCLYRTHSSRFRRNAWGDAPTPYGNKYIFNHFLQIIH